MEDIPTAVVASVPVISNMELESRVSSSVMFSLIGFVGCLWMALFAPC